MPMRTTFQEITYRKYLPEKEKDLTISAKSFIYWHARPDSNGRPTDSKSGALSN
jgi:hypothetical protein